MSSDSDAGFWRVITAIACVLPVGVLLLAVLAGQGWFMEPSAFALHAAIGHMVTLLAALVATFLWLLRAFRYALLATLQAVLLVAQTGLGYAGRRGGVAVASSVHIPLGVTIFGVGLLLAMWLLQRRQRVTHQDLDV